MARYTHPLVKQPLPPLLWSQWMVYLTYIGAFVRRQRALFPVDRR